MKRKQILFSVLLLFSVVATQAARVDTIMVKSPSMNKEVQVVYVLPDKALGEEAEACPVVYLLHGYGGNARSWVGLKPELPKIADEKGIIFVCPDGKNSWYWDSPKNQAYRYETFVASELVKHTDKNYATIPEVDMVLCGLQSVIKRYLVQEEVPVVEWIFALFRRIGR